MGEYFPQHKLPVKKSTLTKVLSKSSTVPSLEDQLAREYKEVYRRLAPPPGAQATPPSAVDVMHYYLQRCRSKPYYGSVFFGGQVARRVNLIQVLLPHLKDRSVVVAINTEGVCILEDAVPRVRAACYLCRGHQWDGFWARVYDSGMIGLDEQAPQHMTDDSGDLSLLRTPRGHQPVGGATALLARTPCLCLCLSVCLSACLQEVMLQLPFDLLSWELHEPHEEGETFFSCLWLEWDSVDPAGSQGEPVQVARRLPIYSRQVRTHLLCGC